MTGVRLRISHLWRMVRLAVLRLRTVRLAWDCLRLTVTGRRRMGLRLAFILQMGLPRRAITRLIPLLRLLLTGLILWRRLRHAAPSM